MEPWRSDISELRCVDIEETNGIWTPCHTCSGHCSSIVRLTRNPLLANRAAKSNLKSVVRGLELCLWCTNRLREIPAVASNSVVREVAVTVRDSYVTPRQNQAVMFCRPTGQDNIYQAHGFDRPVLVKLLSCDVAITLWKKKSKVSNALVSVCCRLHSAIN